MGDVGEHERIVRCLRIALRRRSLRRRAVALLAGVLLLGLTAGFAFYAATLTIAACSQ